MKRLLATVLLCGCLAAPAWAQDVGSPEATRAAQELAAIITGDSISQMSKSVTAQLWPRIEEQFAGKADGATLAELRTEFENALTSFNTSIMKDAPAIYAKHFNVQELRDLLAFYKSPIGTKALQAMPLVIADVTGLMMPRMEGFQRDLAARIQAVMQRRGYKN
jgi:uncharacterized protein